MEAVFADEGCAAIAWRKRYTMFRNRLRTVCHYLVGLLIAAIVMHAWLLLGLIVPVTVSGRSMEPTLSPGERLCVDRTAFLFRAPTRGEVVVFRCPDQADTLCVKRVVGLPGEAVALMGGEVFINGQRMSDPPVQPRGDRPRQNELPPAPISPWPNEPETARPTAWTLAAGQYFVVGDNGAISYDSRNWVPHGGLDAKLLIGKPLGVR
jgi:signal peptidase I